MRQRIAILAVMLAAPSFVNAQAAASQPASAPTAEVSIAIIAPEVLGDLPADRREAMTTAVDTLLTEALSKQKRFVLVDRQALDKVLDEHKALAAGFTGRPQVAGAAKPITANQVAAPLRPFWSAGCSHAPASLCCCTERANGRRRSTGRNACRRSSRRRSGSAIQWVWDGL